MIDRTKGRHHNVIIGDDPIATKSIDKVKQEQIYKWFNSCFDYTNISHNVTIVYLKKHWFETGDTGLYSEEEVDL